MLQGRNKTKMIQDISRIIVPSAETLAIYRSKKLTILIKNVDED